MAKEALDQKRIFLIASDIAARVESYTYVIQKHIKNALVYSAVDGPEALFKIQNDPPHVAIFDIDLPKMRGFECAEHILKNKQQDDISIIFVSDIPDSVHFVDEVVTGRVQFLTNHRDEQQFNFCITKALNRIAQAQDGDFKLLFYPPQTVLFKEGEPADTAYIVKRGRMTAQRGGQVIGNIEEGEFVGEMAHLNKEPRSATVVTSEDCELIEIPFGKLDFVLFSKPAWAKALAMTLSRRLKHATAELAKK